MNTELRGFLGAWNLCVKRSCVPLAQGMGFTASGAVVLEGLLFLRWWKGGLNPPTCSCINIIPVSMKVKQYEKCENCGAVASRVLILTVLISAHS